ncbi:sigma-70 family RNA polymerase sigma factor [Echinicola soli]|uniref:Sigma-70 family RNA polymerase sigma factor n=1 Tax=Echinicola soli TaxID=2591634 RepID=A0A514CIU6_9BACT|nr:sigma-70 family RNA polymerase sigma factor [Echinicola soli]QDH79752.1 sigma-70 family RNA polymerase sigma factor [Echinicola soli]
MIKRIYEDGHKLSKDYEADQKESRDHSFYSSENHAWEEFLKGSDDALAELYNRFADKLFHYGTQITVDREIAYDVVQDVFLYVVVKKKQLGKVDSVKNYLYASYRRRLMRVLKRNRKLKLVEGYDRHDGFLIEVAEDFHAIGTPLTIDIKELLQKVCNQLPIRQREAINLYFFEQLSYKEIAQIMDMGHVRSARNLLYKALGNLAVSLKGHEGVVFLFPLALQLNL